MARPERHDVDYFPFFVKRGRTLNILQSKYGLEGIGFFTNLMRFLALTPDHHYCIKEESDSMNFFAEIGIDENKGTEMIELMVRTEKLDRELWEKHRVVVCEAFLESLQEAYRKRSNKILSLTEIKGIYNNGKKISERITVRKAADILKCNPETIRNCIRELWPNLMQNGVSTSLTEEHLIALRQKITTKFVGEFVGCTENFVGDLQNDEVDLQVCGGNNLQKPGDNLQNTAGLQVCGGNNPQSKVKKSKVKKSKVNSGFAGNETTLQKSEKPKKLPLRERDPVNDFERVEKIYLQNWDSLFARGLVKESNPVVNWNQTRKLLKTHFESLTPELIIQAVNNGLNDEWILNNGYSLNIILSTTVLNRLINTSGVQKHRIGTDNIPKDKVSEFFREASL